MSESLILEFAEEDPYPYYEETVTESSLHLKTGHYLYGVLALRYADRDDVFVGSNQFVYWEEGKKNVKQSPDLFVCFGARNIDRLSYKVWEDVVPQVIIELTSRSTKYTDLGEKKGVYEVRGVEEYYLFDPRAEYIPERLIAYRNGPSGFQPVKVRKRIYSPRLDLDLRVEKKTLRLLEPGSSKRLRTLAEAEAAAHQAEATAHQAEVVAREAELARQAAEERALNAERELEELKRRFKESSSGPVPGA